MPDVDEFLGTRRAGDDVLFALGGDVLGAFGGVFGGLIAASVVRAARDVAPNRVPAGVDCRFLRGLSPGIARVAIDVVHEGRTLLCARGEVFDERGRLASTALVSFLAPDALHPLDADADADAPGPDPGSWRAFSAPAGVDIPIVGVLRPELSAAASGAIATRITIPWIDAGAAHGAEAACVAGDMAVGPPVAAACAGTWLPHPNPDLSMRFVPCADPVNTAVASGRVVRMVGGQVVVAVDVRAGGAVFAAGVATSMVLPAG
jgi:acyl-coenzyme A thioesterase PaaI-like protein